MTETTPLIDSLGNPVPKEAFIVRATEISEFTDCRRKWMMHSQNGFNMEPRVKSRALSIGSIMHKAFEAVRLMNDPMVAAMEALSKYVHGLPEDVLNDVDFQAEYGQDEDLIKGLVTAFNEWSVDNPPAGRVVEVEKRLLVPVLDENNEPLAVAIDTSWSPLYLAARIDGLEEDNSGNFWVNEDKTISKSTNLDVLNHIKLDVQAVLNILAARQVWSDRVIIGSHYFFARKQLPSSRVKNAIFRRTREIRNQAQLDFYKDHLIKVASSMYAVFLGRLPAYPSLPSTGGSQCEWKCDMMPICEALNRGEDVDYLVETMFVQRKPFVETLRAELEDNKMTGSGE